MKHIDRYNKFIKLNEDIRIEGNIDEYDLGIIKDGLIDLTDLGFVIYNINVEDKNIRISLSIEQSKISSNIGFECEFENENHENLYKNDTYDSYKNNPTEYDKLIINTTKECSILILNMLDYNRGSIQITNYNYQTLIIINLSKNKNKYAQYI